MSKSNPRALSTVTPAPPKFYANDVSGGVTVLKLLGHEAQGRVKKEWRYRVKCACGTIYEIGQSSLVQKPAGCVSCGRKRRNEANKRKLAAEKGVAPGEIPADVMSALRGKW